LAVVFVVIINVVVVGVADVSTGVKAGFAALAPLVVR
jgi:hypothetical protein